MSINYEHLRKKGWSDYEVERVKEADLKNKSTPPLRFISENLHWLFLLVTVIGNLLFITGTLPLVVAGSQQSLLLTLGFSGFVFGSLFADLLLSVERAGKTHHILYASLTFITVVTSSLLVVKFANNLRSVFGFKPAHLTPGIIYFACFMLPYAVMTRMRGKL